MKWLSTKKLNKKKWELFIFWIVRKEENSCIDDNNNYRANWIYEDQFLNSIIEVHVVWWVIFYKIYLWNYSNSGRNVMICKECPKFLLGLFFFHGENDFYFILIFIWKEPKIQSSSEQCTMKIYCFITNCLLDFSLLVHMPWKKVRLFC